MKGYKGFNKGMICRGKQYAENTVFEEPEANICENGMHFCKNPLDVLDFYDFMADNGEPNEFAAVEALGEAKTDNYQKYCTKKLKIGAKLSLAEFIQVCARKAESLDSSKDFAKICRSADNIQVGVTGVRSKVVSTGNLSKVAVTGNESNIVVTGDYSDVGVTGDCPLIMVTGCSSQVASTGRHSKVTATSNSSMVISMGNFSSVITEGMYSHIVVTGNYSTVTSTGSKSKVISMGESCIICCIGRDSRAKAKKGSWITLGEWKWSEEKEDHMPVCVKTEQVDGERIKEDVFYMLRDGEFQEVV